MDMGGLPWVDIEDKDGVYQAVPFLPNNPVILEAGACAAEDTIRFKHVWPASVIYCFEPTPCLFEIASRNIANPPSRFSKTENLDGIHLYNCALSDAVGEQPFFVGGNMPATSSLFQDNWENITLPDSVCESVGIPREKLAKMGYNDQPTTVQTTTIDAWRKENSIGDIDYIWLDTEGAELLVLSGALETLPRVKVLHLEFSMQEFRKGWVLFDDLYKFVDEHGFVIKAIWQVHENWTGNAVFVSKELA